MKHIGNLIIEDNSDYSHITEINGNLQINSKAELPNLTSVGGYLYIYSKAELPNLKSIGGDLYINSNGSLVADNLTSVGGYLQINSKAELPNLTSVGGYLQINSNGSLKADFLKYLNYKIVDNSIFVIESKKIKDDIKIYKGYNIVGLENSIPKKEPCYVAELNDFYAHGKTIKKAIEDLNFKVLSDKLKHEKINADTIIDAKYYRIITGACEFGVNSFIKSNNLKKSYRADELFEILNNHKPYGFENFKQLLNF